MRDVMNWKYFSINNSEFLYLNIKIKVSHWVEAFSFSILTPFLPFLLVVGNMLIPIVICKYCILLFMGQVLFRWNDLNVMCLNNRNWFYTVFSGWILTQASLSSIPFYFLSLSWYLLRCHKGWRNFWSFSSGLV